MLTQTPKKGRNAGDFEEDSGFGVGSGGSKGMLYEFQRLTQKINAKAAKTTAQLPIKGEATLFLSGGLQIVKLGKEAPEVREAVEYLIKNPRIRYAKRIVVRENGVGLVPVLLALQFKAKTFDVSLWTLNTLPILRKNIFGNGVEERIRISVEAKASRKGGVAILVHEPFQARATVLAEIRDLLGLSRTGIVYVISHKSKGIETLLRDINESNMVGEVVARGLGGARVIEVTAGVSQNYKDFVGDASGFECTAAEKKISFRTAYSLFSPEKVDGGSAMLIRYVFKITAADKLAALKVYDMACGYGALALSILSARENATAVLSDSDARAVNLAQLNAKLQGIAARVKVVLADGPDGVTGEYDLVVSNPPLHISRGHLVEVLYNARKLVKKGGRLILVVEDSRVVEVCGLMKDKGIYFTKVFDGGTHSVLEYKK